MSEKNRFKPVDPKQNFVEMEKNLLKLWYEKGIVQKYLGKNKKAKEKFSFLDGPITANNPMGVHHAWGRTYKDLWQRYFSMKGYAQRFQNGFDEQGLWIEVEVEKELGFKSKKDIEKYGIGKFIQKCRERVGKFAKIQTEQSKRLGYFMDWENSYHTSSEQNNYAIWKFLKVCYEKGYLYKGRDSVPWCPRCGTAISQHEILTEEYKEITHKSVYIKYQLAGKAEKLLVWTTTPWTLPSNIAVAVNPNLNYGIWEINRESLIIELTRAKEIGIKENPKKTFKGKTIVGSIYEGVFDELPALKGVEHKIVAAKDLVTAEEGTGLVHISPAGGAEDFKLAKSEKLPVIPSIDEEGTYIEGFGDLSGKNATKNPELIIEKLENKKSLFKVEKYKHRYPTCWRCKTELVWRVVDEWYIAMDLKDPDDKKSRTLRQEMIDVAKKINWIPQFGFDRELDWLNNMHDWLISKKRYWGLALPIWECANCNHFEVIGSKKELAERAVKGLSELKGKSPHRPQIDNVIIRCSHCEKEVTRISDVGNVWLDAGIVPISTMPESWYPADFITESFPGQFKNWFYSLIAMSTVLKGSNPYKTVLGFATLLDEKGEEMHKSKGNAIEFNEAADKIGVDVMRWMYLKQNPINNLLFGYHKADEVRRRFYLILWNSYKYFVDYANLANWNSKKTSKNFQSELTILDRWILSSLTKTILEVNSLLESYDPMTASRRIEEFIVHDLSTWYIRRSRNRVGPGKSGDSENVFLSVMHLVLTTVSKLVAPFMPFVAENVYQNLTGDESVHLQKYPEGDKKMLDNKLISDMNKARSITEEAHSIRKDKGVKVRQPLKSLTYGGTKLGTDIEKIIAEELNVKKVIFSKNAKIGLDTKITQGLKEEGEAREIIRNIQQARKVAGCNLSEYITVKIPDWPTKFEAEIKRETLASSLKRAEKLEIARKQNA